MDYLSEYNKRYLRYLRKLIIKSIISPWHHNKFEEEFRKKMDREYKKLDSNFLMDNQYKWK